MKKSYSSKNAAAVILLRPAVNGEFEVLLTHRSTGTKNHGGVYSFPGGSVKKEDCLAAILRRLRGISPTEARKIVGSELTPELSLGHWVAGARGIFEEVGVLLCTTEDGTSLEIGDFRVREELAQERKALIDESKDFLTLLESKGLFCDAARLVYFSQWSVQEDSPTCMDTLFFLTLLPLDQPLLSGSQKTERCLWITPERALDLCQQGTLPLRFSTFASLRTLADFDSWEDIASEYGLR
jgi:hypothetical protein